MALPAQILTSDAVTAYRTSINGLAAYVPPVKTTVDMVPMLPLPGLSVVADSATTVAWTDLSQNAYLCLLPHRIASATRIRWRYIQSNSALTGNYVIGIYDASGTKIIDTGSVALTGGVGTVQARAETISATTFEAGMYYVLFGVDLPSSGNVVASGLVDTAHVGMANVALRITTGGVTAPANLSGLTDQVGVAAVGYAPVVSLSVG